MLDDKIWFRNYQVREQFSYAFAAVALNKSTDCREGSTTAKRPATDEPDRDWTPLRPNADPYLRGCIQRRDRILQPRYTLRSLQCCHGTDQCICQSSYRPPPSGLLSTARRAQNTATESTPRRSRSVGRISGSWKRTSLLYQRCLLELIACNIPPLPPIARARAPGCHSILRIGD